MPNEQQFEFWNNEGGEFWASEANRLDQFLEPLIPAILEPIQNLPIQHVLDIGCGPGALSLAAAQYFNSVTGIDLSNKLISLAWEEALSKSVSVQFVVGDAATYEPSIPFDALISRFGVMFFDQPEVTFSALRKRSKPGAHLSMATWAPMESNRWIMETAELVQAEFRGPLPTPAPDAPGPFSLSNPVRVKRLLTETGWENISITHWQHLMGMPVQTPEEAAVFFSGISPICRSVLKQGADPVKLLTKLSAFYQTKLQKAGKLQVQGAALIIQATA